MSLDGDPRYLSIPGLNLPRLMSFPLPSSPQVQAFSCLGNGLEQCREPQGSRSAVCADWQVDRGGDCKGAA